MLILGGRVERVAVICDVSAQTVFTWLNRGRIFDAQHAVAVANACAERGHPEITVARLAGLEEGTQAQHGASTASRHPCTDTPPEAA